jgi:class 3 adenylate cyclase
VCGFEYEGSFKFCPECAAPLVALGRAVGEERKVVTTLFCDLVGLTASAESADPEDVDRMLSAYSAMARARMDDIAAAVFTRATGVEWSEVTKDEVQQHVGEAQLHLQDGVTAFMRFANPALMEMVTRAIARGASFYKVGRTLFLCRSPTHRQSDSLRA